MEPSTPLGDQALYYADQYGYEVFPLIPTGKFGKTPLTAHGMLDASSDLDQIRAWWERWPDALIGHRIPVDQIVLDVDPRHDGMVVYEALAGEFDIMPGRVHISGRGDGGGHLHFHRPEGRLSMTRVAEWAKGRGLGHAKGDRWITGIDLLHHDHRYTVLPRSPHPDTGMPYFWRGNGPEDPPGVLPPAFVELLQAPPEVEKPEPGPHDPNSIADWFSATQGFSWLTDDGWSLTKGDGTSDGSAWRHPEATHAVSATVRNGCLFVYSENTPFEVTMPGDPAGYTPFHAWAVLHHEGDLSEAARVARKVKRSEDERKLEKLLADAMDMKASIGAHTNGKTNGKVASFECVFEPGIEFKAEPIRFLWEPGVPRGALTLLAADPGKGKGLVASALVAAMTNGVPLPGKQVGAGSVAWVTYEEAWNFAIRPRLDVAGADLARVFRPAFLRAKDKRDGRLGVGDLDSLRVAIKRQGDVSLIVLDPLVSFCGADVNVNANNEVRGALEPFVQMAEELDIGLLGIMHLNKAELSQILYRVANSISFSGVARSVMAIGDLEDGRRVLAHIKASYTEEFAPVPFTIAGQYHPGIDQAVGRVFWEEPNPEIDKFRIFDGPGRKEDKGGSIAECVEFLRNVLANGPQYVKDVKQQMLGRNWGRRTIDEARCIAGIETLDRGVNARWSLGPGVPQGWVGGSSGPTQGEVDLTESSSRYTTHPPGGTPGTGIEEGDA